LRPSISVVICAYTLDRAEILGEAIRSVAGQTCPALEILLVADHNAALAAWARQSFPMATVIENDRAKGLSGARNTGVARARGDVVAFLDDDAVADPTWLALLSEAYADPATIGAGGGIEPVWPGGRPAWLPREFDWVVGCSYEGLPKRIAPVRNLIGCNMSVRRDVLARVGAFREDLGRDGDNASGCEETELYIRAAAAFPAGRILYVPEAVVRHHITGPRTRWAYFRARCRAEGRSKASMVRSVGGRDGLSTEAAYVSRTLPAGVVAGLGAALRGDGSGLYRAGAIVAGLWFVGSSYVAGTIGRRFGRKPAPAAEFRPWRIVDADLDAGLPDLRAVDPDTGVRYGGAWCMVRSGGRPVKILQVPLAAGDVDAAAFTGLVRADETPMPAPPLPRPAADAPPAVSVVIATRDRPDMLARCLDSLLGQSRRALEIIVADNAPATSATADMIAARYADAGVRYVREDRPGLGIAHNAGLALARGDVVAFTDDDVIVDEDWVAAIAANFAASDRIGCVTGMIAPAELLTRAQYWTECHGGFGKGVERRLFDLDAHRPRDPLFPFTAGAFGSGANMAFSRAALDAIGGFDPALGAGTKARGGDDLDSFLAVIRAGFRVAYDPGAIVWHHHRRGEEGMRRQAYGYGVGLGAYLTKQVIEDPAVLAFLLRRAPAAVAHMFGGSSEKLARLPDDYPRSLVWRERLGILMGVPGYLRSRRDRDRRPGRRLRLPLLSPQSRS
jgi:glycosyltransferase involved in cell wall biosynthesis